MITYCIVPVNEISNAMLNICVAGKQENMRKNVNGTEIIFKFCTSDLLAKEVFKNYLWLNSKEILEVITEENGW